MRWHIIIKIKVFCLRSALHRKVKQNDNLCPVQDSGSMTLGEWSSGAMVLGKLPVPGRPTNLDQSRAKAYSRCGWGLFGRFFSRLSFLFSFSLSLWETARYRLKYCLKGPLSPYQPTNQHPWLCSRSQPGIKSQYKGPVGHLLHSVTLLIFRSASIL